MYVSSLKQRNNHSVQSQNFSLHIVNYYLSIFSYIIFFLFVAGKIRRLRLFNISVSSKLYIFLYIKI